MARPYASFLLRCWVVGGDDLRIEVEHLQTRERVRLASLAAAADWIGAHATRSAEPGGLVEVAREPETSAPEPQAADSDERDLDDSGGPGSRPESRRRP